LATSRQYGNALLGVRHQEEEKVIAYLESCLGLKSGDAPEKRPVWSGVSGADQRQTTGEFINLSLLIDS